MNTVHNTPDGVYMEIEIDGVLEKRTCEMMVSKNLSGMDMLVPELKEGERLLVDTSGIMRIVTVHKG